MRGSIQRRRKQRGAALVEFALMALVLYLLVAGGVELGREIFVSQTLQDAARIAARELSVTPLPAGCTFEDALSYPYVADPMSCPPDPSSSVNVTAQIWDPRILVVDLDALQANNVDLDAYFNSLPLVNRALRPVFISDTVTFDNGQTYRHLLRYPGALLTDANPPMGFYTGGFTVGIPEVLTRDSSTGEETTLRWVPVLTEVRSDPGDPKCGPFSLAAPTLNPGECGMSFDPTVARGIAAIAVNYPFQSAALSGFRSAGYETQPPDAGAPKANIGNVIPANDAAVTTVTGDSPGAAAGGQSNTPYSGDYGLGSQYAFAGTIQPTGTVRPYRSLLLGQAMFRREVVQ